MFLNFWPSFLWTELKGMIIEADPSKILNSYYLLASCYIFLSIKCNSFQ
ncbi:hypothetical protein BVRB_4g093490 [Beta vulgaris subsp. vulgaris]|uniref:Uncharacterized protein n=1 Tax=Beta vulgaris subsp. vulgaris TaxID=3555 RepID=A0A0J8E581_BETVV|nr:hypothetical protein BVRB_4g093490 [Beta vulgaris subsp. vulgaris]